MKGKPTPIASAVALALMSAAFQVHSQQAETKAPEKTTAIEPVVVTGIRGSLEQSLNVKRNSESVVEVITAEDIGKMPDKNVADSLQRVPGLTISSASASEGGFDENDRVSMRGTNPSLTQTLINGHMVSSGDWFVLNQVGTVGRSVSYTLLPSELVGQVVVRKSAQADLVEGGVAGTVDILTRRPLAFKNPITAEASVGGVYADLPKKTDPQFSGLFNWKNPSDSVGVLFQAFYEKRHLRRDGQEMLGYSKITPAMATSMGTPALANVAYPNAIGSALFEQERERHGGLLDLQVKPTDALTLDLSGFYSHLKATNYNRNWLIFPTFFIGRDTRTPSSFTVQNGTLTSAVFPNVGTAANPAQYAIVDNIYRPGANSETSFVDLDAKYRATDRLTFTGKVGKTRGVGETPKQSVFEGDVFNTGASWNLHGISNPADATTLTGNPAVFTGTALDFIFGASPARTKDEETYGQADGEYAFDKGVFTSLKFGARTAEHKRESIFIAQGPNFALDPFNPANLPRWDGTTYPSNFGKGLGGGDFLKNVWQLQPGELERWGDIFSNRDPLVRENFAGEFSLKEKSHAVYVMSSLEGPGWAGNVGVRFVRTEERVTDNIAIPTNPTGNPATPDDCAATKPCSVPGAVTTSAFGAFRRELIANDYNDVLPSANFKFDLSRDLVGRLAVARTMARADFSALGGAISLNDTLLTGQGGNPNLKPIRSNNFDAALEWYFAPKALLSAGLFYMDLKSYVSFGTFQGTFRNIRTNSDAVYTISAPVNSSGSVKGIELAYQQPFAGGFGILTNYTYADAKEDGPPNPNTGRNDLVGASKHTANLTGFYENDSFSARLAYTYRSSFYNGLDRSTAQYQYATGTLAASLGYQLTGNFTVTFDALNLNNPTLKYYGNNKDQPTAFYSNGRQYYLTLRMKI
jgi:iron complex outermembrane receptor protein